jgi:Flp pilus assembly pilin Flp
VTQQMILKKVSRLWASMTVQVGQGLAEYALILALIAIVAILALIFLGSQISDKLSIVGSSV